MSESGMSAAGCPICGKPVNPAYKPFCSRRCANVDLHRWMSGTYAIPAAEGSLAPEDEDDEGRHS